MKMKSWPAAFFLITPLLIASPTFAQSPDAPLLTRACGSESVQFDANADASQHPLAQPEAGKATIYVIGSFIGNSEAKSTVRVGVDGAWVSAIHGDSYTFFSVPPGDLHLCVNWQSGFLTPSGLFALAHLKAEAGKTYYFRVRTYNASNQTYSIDLDAQDGDEGQYLVASSTFSKSHPKK